MNEVTLVNCSEYSKYFIEDVKSSLDRLTSTKYVSIQVFRHVQCEGRGTDIIFKKNDLLFSVEGTPENVKGSVNISLDHILSLAKEEGEIVLRDVGKLQYNAIHELLIIEPDMERGSMGKMINICRQYNLRKIVVADEKVYINNIKPDVFEKVVANEDVTIKTPYGSFKFDKNTIKYEGNLEEAKRFVAELLQKYQVQYVCIRCGDTLPLRVELKEQLSPITKTLGRVVQEIYNFVKPG